MWRRGRKELGGNGRSNLRGQFLKSVKLANFLHEFIILYHFFNSLIYFVLHLLSIFFIM